MKSIKFTGFIPPGLLIILFAVIVALIFTCRDCGFMTYRNTAEYVPISESGKGAQGKINKLLEEALKKNQGSTNGNPLFFNNKTLSAPSLKFYIPDSSDYIYRSEDIRVIDYIPSNREDSVILFNTRFAELLAAQRADLAENVFIIDFENKNVSLNKLKITSIRVKPELLQTKLQPNKWGGFLIGRTPGLLSPPNVSYIVFSSAILPLPRLSASPLTEYSPFEVFENNIRINENDKIKRGDYREHIRNLQNKWLKLSIERNIGPEKYVAIAIVKDSICIQLQGCKIKYFDGLTDTMITPSPQANANEIYRIAFKKNVSINILSDRNKLLASFYATKNNPFEIISAPYLTQRGVSRFVKDTSEFDYMMEQFVDKLIPKLEQTNKDTVRLSLDYLLNKALFHKLKKYADSLQTGENPPGKNGNIWYEISLTVMDTKTGKVLAVPSYSTESIPSEYRIYKRNLNLTNNPIGSTFKPLLSLAALIRNPNILEFTLNDSNRSYDDKNDVCYIFNLPMQNIREHSYFSKRGVVGFKKFLSNSDNAFAAALGVLSFENRSNLSGPVGRNYNAKTNNSIYSIAGFNSEFQNNNNISNTEFVKLFGVLYNTRYLQGDGSYQSRFIDSTWYNLASDSNRFGDISPERVSMGFDSWDNSDIRSVLYTWCLGQGTNYWNNIKLAEAWSRMVSKTAVHSSFVEYDTIFPPLLPIVRSTVVPFDSQLVVSKWNRFLQILSAAQQGGLLDSASETFESYQSNAQKKCVLLAKTGTIQDADITGSLSIIKKAKMANWRTFIERGMYAFTLLPEKNFAMITGQQTQNRLNKVQLGVTCIINISRVVVYPSGPRKEGKISSKAAYKLLDTDFYDLLTKYCASSFEEVR